MNVFLPSLRILLQLLSYETRTQPFVSNLVRIFNQIQLLLKQLMLKNSFQLTESRKLLLNLLQEKFKVPNQFRKRIRNRLHLILSTFSMKSLIISSEQIQHWTSFQFQLRSQTLWPLETM